MLLVIVNAYAGYVRRQGVERMLRQLQATVADRGHVVLTTDVGTLDDVLRSYDPDSLDALVPVGGDGTVSTVLSRAAAVWGMERLPPILTVFAGTMNMVAHTAHGQVEGPVETLQRMLSKPVGRWQHKRQTVIVTSSGRLGFAAGFGVPTRFLTYYYGLGGGNLAALRSIADHAFSVLRRGELARQLFAPLKVTTQGLDGGEQQTLSIVLALTLGTLPLGFRIDTPEHGQMLVLSGNPKPYRLIASLPLIQRGVIPDVIGVKKQTAAQLSVEFAQPTTWQLDGDVQPAVRELSWDASQHVTLVC